MNLPNAKQLLYLLTVRMPPGKNMRHNLTLNSKGDLEVCLMLEDTFWPIVLEENDLTKPADSLATEICNTIEKAKVI